MSETREAVIISAARTPVGKFLGSLKGFTATDLGPLLCARASSARVCPLKTLMK